MRKLLIIGLLIVSQFLGCASQPDYSALISQAAEIRSDTLYDSIVIEIVPSIEHTPSQRFLEIFKDRLEKNNFCKAENIHIIIQKPAKDLPFYWTYGMIYNHENNYRLLYDPDPDDRHLVLFIANLPGRCIEPKHGNLAGLHFTRTGFIYFFQGRETMSAWLHEFGHVIGLVDYKTRGCEPANPERPTHCNNKKCYMFWRIGGTHFDKECRRDIRKLIRRSYRKRRGRLF